MRSTLLALAAAALAGASVGAPMASSGSLAPLYTPPPPPPDRLQQPVGIQGGVGAESHLIPDSYIVVFKKGLQPTFHDDHLLAVRSKWQEVSSSKLALDLSWDAIYQGVQHVYSLGKDNFRGYSIHMPESMLQFIRALPEVAYVERDSIVSINDPYWQASATAAPLADASSVDTEYGAPWGLARISHRERLTFGTSRVYNYDHQAGSGVTVYVIDTGVNLDHIELEGRAMWGKTVPKDVDRDSNGHGSHVAGTIASRAYGVAKNASVVAVKVLGAGGSGSMADVIAGVIWAAEHAQATAIEEAKKSDSNHKGSVANMSLGGGKSMALDEVVNGAVDTGLHFAVAAGNDNRDACTFSPAAAVNPITVGASTIRDERAYFSNHGGCVDIFAPGLQILSIWNTGNVSTNVISGTSMASPHIAGLAAYVLSLYPEKIDVASILGEKEAVASSEFAWSRAGQLVFGRLRQSLGLARGQGDDKTPAPLSPKTLKKLLISLATKDILSELPGRTVNALAFNNVTA